MYGVIEGNEPLLSQSLTGCKYICTHAMYGVIEGNEPLLSQSLTGCKYSPD
jgi:hypothetical protein